MPIDASRIQKPVRKLGKFLKSSPKRPTPDQVHRVRTNLRRFEATINALGLGQHKNERRLIRHLASIRKLAGKVRDVDVLIGYALSAVVAGEQNCVVQLVEHLGTRRTRHARKLRGAVAAKGPMLRRRLKRSESKLLDAVQKMQEKGSDSVPDAAAEAMARALQVTQELKNPQRLNKRNLHAYRLKVKELRYILELAEHADRGDFVNKLGEVKDAIGEWHDWQELIAIASEVLDHGPQCKFLSRLRSIIEEKYASALSQATTLRRDFLDSTGSRKRSVSRSRKPVSTQALTATSAISA